MPSFKQRDYPRSVRIAELLQRQLMQLVREQLRDPQLAWASITHVNVTRDLKTAVIMVSHLEHDKSEACAKSLNKAASFLRAKLGVLNLKVIPQLHFKADMQLQESERLETLIEQARSRDQDSHALASDDE